MTSVTSMPSSRSRAGSSSRRRSPQGNRTGPRTPSPTIASASARAAPRSPTARPSGCRTGPRLDAERLRRARAGGPHAGPIARPSRRAPRHAPQRRAADRGEVNATTSNSPSRPNASSTGRQSSGGANVRSGHSSTAMGTARSASTSPGNVPADAVTTTVPSIRARARAARRRAGSPRESTRPRRPAAARRAPRPVAAAAASSDTGRRLDAFQSPLATQRHHPSAHRQLAATAELGVGRDRHLAAALERAEEGALGRHGQRSRRMMHGARRRGRRGVTRAGGDGERSLTRRRQHHVDRQPLADAALESQPHESRGGEENRGPLRVRVELGDAGVHVAADVAHLQIGSEMQQLRPAAKAARGERSRPGEAPATRAGRGQPARRARRLAPRWPPARCRPAGRWEGP